MAFLRSWVLHNAGTKILAVVLSFLLWTVFAAK
jgi:hypothetical protein